MSQSVKGTIKTITPETTFGKMRKKSVILTTEEQYPQTLEVEFVNDKTSLIQGYDPGEKVEIAINIRGREWTSPKNEVKYFTSLTGWKIDRSVGLTNATQNQDRKEAQIDDLAF
jgi:single-strand DNA-binding protein